jgi:hypothetical protein
LRGLGYRLLSRAMSAPGGRKHTSAGPLVWKLTVFGAYKFHPFVQGPPKRHGRRPGHRKSAFILDADLDLDPLALVVGIGSRSVVNIRTGELEMLFCGPFDCFLRRLIIEQPVQFPKITNAVLGTKFKIVTGYPGTKIVSLCMSELV